MAAGSPPGSKKSLSDSRAEALQAIVSSLSPGENSSAKTPSKEDVSKLSDKLKELLSDVDPPQEAVQRNERGQLLNEEGLPIIEITEQMEGIPETAPGAGSGTGLIADKDDTGFVPMYRLPPTERARNRAQMDRILDILEEEERIGEERNRARDRELRQEELERRKANAKAELDRLKAAKEVQKKMGKALLKNMADAREKEEEERVRQEKEDLEKEENRRSRKPRKSVSWAELPKQDKSSARSDEDAARPLCKLPMRPNVVERYSARPGASSPPPPVPTGDSDDESGPPSPDPSDSDPGEGTSTDGFPLSHTENALSEGSEDEDEDAESQGSEDGFDIDAVQHQREIALAYFEKRNAIGADAARAMSAHSHGAGGEDEWDQEDVPLEATLAGPRPKPAQSKFRSERLAQAYGTRVPSSTQSTSLGTSVLPNSASALRGAVRMGKLGADGRLAGNSDSEEDEAARAHEFVDALYRGEVTNAGAEENSDALIAALESAYGAPPPPKQPPTTASIITEPNVLASSAPTNSPLHSQKGLRFKPARAVPPRTLAGDEGAREGGASLPSKPPTSATVAGSTSAPAPTASPSSSRSTTAVDTGGSLLASAQLPSMIVDSPSFTPLGRDAPTMVIDSPSFRPPPSSVRPRRPPTVLATVRESSPSTQQQRGQAPEPEKKVSRFKAQRAET